MKIKKFFRFHKGFTLIELLIVIGIIAILMAIAIVAINPGRQFAKANNAKRWGDVSAIANAISLKIVEERGGWATSLNCEDLSVWTGGPEALAYDDPGSGADDANVDICDCIVPDYLGSMPVDPTTGVEPTTRPCSATGETGYDTGYKISRVTEGRITISAPDADDEGTGAPTISVSR